MKKEKLNSQDSPVSAVKKTKISGNKKNTKHDPSSETKIKQLNNKLAETTAGVKFQRSQLREVRHQLKIALENYRNSGEEKFRILTETSPYAIMIIQNDYLVYTNPAGENITGYPARELYKMKFWEIVSPKFKKKIIQTGKNLEKGKINNASYEFLITAKNKSQKWLFVTGSSIIHNGKPGVILFVVDITHRKQTELALAESEKRYRLFINATEDMAFLKDDQLRYMIVNPANVAYFGQDESQIIGKTDFDLMPETMAKLCYISDRLALSSDNINIKEEKIGNEIYETHKFKVPLSGKKLGVGGYIRNITARRRAEQLQRVLYTISNAVNTTNNITDLIELVREQLGALLDTSNFFIAFYDEETGMLSTPFAADEKDTISSFPAEKSATGYVIKKQRSLLATETDFQKLYAKGEIKKMGSPAKVWLGVPLRVEGRVIGAIVVQNYQDVNAFSKDDVKMLEFVSHQISNSLQRKRTEEELKAALVKAEESDRLKTAFLANLSHEIRTPMNAILGFSNLLNNENYSETEKSNFISIIQKSGKQLLCIISDIIDISKIVNNQVTINKNTFNINSLLDSLLTSFEIQKSSLGKLDIKLILEKSLKDELVYLDTDEVKVVQIFNNLLYNALKFTKKGFIRFGCTQENGKPLFFVEDTGIGIAVDKQDIVFLRFRQENESQAATFGGSGLGLSISKGLVELLGGRIWVKSVKGKGSTFFFTLPESAFGHHTFSKQNQEASVEKFDFSKKTILIADDNSDNVELIRNLLSGANPSLIIAKNGLEAVEICKKNKKVDLVLMDIRMPVMDGYSATAKIRKFNSVLPIIALSALAFTEDFERLNDVGCTNFITKPIDNNIFLPLLKKHLS